MKLKQGTKNNYNDVYTSTYNKISHRVGHKNLENNFF